MSSEKVDKIQCYSDFCYALFPIQVNYVQYVLFVLIYSIEHNDRGRIKMTVMLIMHQASQLSNCTVHTWQDFSYHPNQNQLVHNCIFLSLMCSENLMACVKINVVDFHLLPF